MPLQAAGKGFHANEREPSGDEASDQAETRNGGQAHRSRKRRKAAAPDASDGGEDFDDPAIYVATAISSRLDKLVGKGARMVAKASGP